MREAVAKRVVRGSVAVNLNVRRTEGASQLRLNEAALQQVLAAVEAVLAHQGGGAARRRLARHPRRVGGGRARGG